MTARPISWLLVKLHPRNGVCFSMCTYSFNVICWFPSLVLGLGSSDSSPTWVTGTQVGPSPAAVEGQDPGGSIVEWQHPKHSSSVPRHPPHEDRFNVPSMLKRKCHLEIGLVVLNSLNPNLLASLPPVCRLDFLCCRLAGTLGSDSLPWV